MEEPAERKTESSETKGGSRERERHAPVQEDPELAMLIYNFNFLVPYAVTFCHFTAFAILFDFHCVFFFRQEARYLQFYFCATLFSVET